MEPGENRSKNPYPPAAPPAPVASPRVSTPHPHHADPGAGPARSHGPVEDLEPPARRSPRRLALQAAAAVASIALLVWAASLALTPENQDRLRGLADAPPHLVAALVALVVASVVLNGAIFQVVLGHTTRLGVLYVSAVTAMATLVAYAPFKLSLLLRAFIHRRRDRLRYKTLVAWFAATAGLSLCVLVPATLASMGRASLDATWALGTLAAPALLLALAVVVARRVRTVRALHAVTLGAADYAVSPARVAAVGLLRLADLASMAARFWIAAHILGIGFTPADAVFASAVYFVTGILSPSGNLGAREGAVTGVGFLPVVTSASGDLALVALTVTAAEILGALLAAAAGFLYVRPDRLLAALPESPADQRSGDTSSSTARVERSED